MSFPETVIFDLDGTLVDTAPDITAALNHTLQTLSFPVASEAEVRHMVGQGARTLIEKGVAAAGSSLSPVELEAAFATFLDYYGDHVADRSVPFPHAVEVLDQLAGDGIGMGVCTNKPQGLSDMLLEALDLDEYFDAVLGADSVPNPKPHGDHLLQTIARMGRDPASAVMVGDSQTDVGAARDAGVPIVAVSFGYTIVPPSELGADRLIDSFADLPGALEGLLDKT